VDSPPAHDLAACGLCSELRELRDSHFMPAALYPKNKKKALATRTETILDPDQIQERFLCEECEQRFNRNGESEVLRWIAPKAKTGASPLQEALRKTPAWTHPSDDLTCHLSASLGISPEKFAYFALSLVWRAAAHAWPVQDGSLTTPLDLADFAEPVRQFLLGKASFPSHTLIMLTVCSDERSQEYWMPPTRSGEIEGLIVVPINGVLFRVWMGRVVPSRLHPQSIFFPSPDNPVFRTNCWDILSQGLSTLFPT